jgi:hypothetical protein
MGGVLASPKASDARPPISADRTTFASATSAAGSSEVGKDLSFGNALGLHLPTGPPRKLNVKASLHVIRKIRLIPGHEETGWEPIAGDEDEVTRAKHLRSTVTKVPKRCHLHVITSVTTITLGQAKVHDSTNYARR